MYCVGYPLELQVNLRCWRWSFVLWWLAIIESWLFSDQLLHKCTENSLVYWLWGNSECMFVWVSLLMFVQNWSKYMYNFTKANRLKSIMEEILCNIAVYNEFQLKWHISNSTHVVGCHLQFFHAKSFRHSLMCLDHFFNPKNVNPHRNNPLINPPSH